MPHLDARALTADPEGLEFLKDILDAPLQPKIPVGMFDVTPAAASSPQGDVESGEFGRRRRREPLSELA